MTSAYCETTDPPSAQLQCTVGIQKQKLRKINSTFWLFLYIIREVHTGFKHASAHVISYLIKEGQNLPAAILVWILLLQTVISTSL